MSGKTVSAVQAGIQTANVLLTLLDSGLRRNDGKKAEESC